MYRALTKTRKGVRNPLWHLRFTLPEFGSWKTVALPGTRTHAQGEGLDFWGRYMNPAMLAEVHRAVTREHGGFGGTAAVHRNGNRSETF